MTQLEDTAMLHIGLVSRLEYAAIVDIEMPYRFYTVGHFALFRVCS